MTRSIEQRAADTIRVLSMDAVQEANSGHPGMPMGMADIAVVLWSQFLNVDPANPTWHDRDRFVLSNGHGSMLLYSLLHLSGFDLSMDEIANFRQWGYETAGHPEFNPAVGIETTTGPLGQGFGTAVGMAQRKSIFVRSTVRIWSTTTPTCSVATAISWKASHQRPHRLQDTSVSAS